MAFQAIGLSNCRPQKPPIPKNKPKLVTSLSTKTTDEFRCSGISDQITNTSALSEKETEKTNSALKRQRKPERNDAEFHSKPKVHFRDDQNNDSSPAITRAQTEPDVVYSVVNKHKKDIDKTLSHLVKSTEGDRAKSQGYDNRNDHLILGKDRVLNMSRSLSEDKDISVANLANTPKGPIVQNQVAYFESLDDTDYKPENKSTNHQPSDGKTVKFKSPHDKHQPPYNGVKYKSTFTEQSHERERHLEDDDPLTPAIPKKIFGSNSIIKQPVGDSKLVENAVRDHPQIHSDQKVATSQSSSSPSRNLRTVSAQKGGGEPQALTSNKTVSRPPGNNANTLQQSDDEDYTTVNEFSAAADDIEPYATSKLTDVRKSEPSTSSSVSSLVPTPTGAVASTASNNCPHGVVGNNDTLETEDVKPYATSRKKGALYSSAEEEYPYEEISTQLVQRWDEGTRSSESTITVDKHVYNYICTYEDQEKQWHVNLDPDTNRKLIFSANSAQDYLSFVKLYERIEAMLWVEGIKASSVANMNGVLDTLQSKFQCIWTRPNEEDVEIICKKEDVDEIKKTVESFADRDVHFIYERAKSEMDPVPSEPKLMIVSPIACGYNINGNNVYIHLADITKLKVAAIVNAANGYLNHGSGVARAISDAAGKQWGRECSDYVKKHGHIEVTTVGETTAGDLPCEAVLHAVGPKWPKGGNSDKQEECRKKIEKTFTNILSTVARREFKSVALPPISSGKFGCPHTDVACAIYEALMHCGTLEKCQELHVVDLRADVLTLVKEKLDNASQYRESPTVATIPAGDVQTAIYNIQDATIVKKKKHGKKIWALFTKRHNAA